MRAIPLVSLTVVLDPDDADSLDLVSIVISTVSFCCCVVEDEENRSDDKDEEEDFDDDDGEDEENRREAMTEETGGTTSTSAKGALNSTALSVVPLNRKPVMNMISIIMVSFCAL